MTEKVGDTPQTDAFPTREAVAEALASGRTSEARVRKAYELGLAAAAREAQIGDGGLLANPGDPAYTSFGDWCVSTTPQYKRKWLGGMAKRANRDRLMSGKAEVRVTGPVVWSVILQAQGRCIYCGSLAVEGRPSQSNGSPLPWEHVGRRIGSLAHLQARFHGGDNDPANLAWSCLWCNTWLSERKRGATDRGGLQVREPTELGKFEAPWPGSAIPAEALAVTLGDREAKMNTVRSGEQQAKQPRSQLRAVTPVRVLREQAKLTESEAGVRLDLSSEKISELEQSTSLGLGDIVRYATALGFEIDLVATKDEKRIWLATTKPPRLGRNR